MPNSAADALLTKRYGRWQRPIAQKNTFLKSLPFVESSDKSGKDFTMPILTAISQGVTPDNTGNVINLKGARPGQNSQAVLDGVNLYIQEQLSYSDLMKMGNGASESGDAAAYESGPDWVMYSMRLGLKHHAEMMALYGSGTSATLAGGGDIGVLDTSPIVTGTNISGAGVTVKISTATWAKLLWLNSGSGGVANTGSGMLIDIYDTTGTTLRANNVRVVGVTDSTKCRIAIVATAATSTGPTYVPVATDRLIPSGWAAASAMGVSPIFQLSGTFAGIDNTVVPQWKPQSYDCNGGALTTDMVQDFASKLIGNGFEQGEFDVWSSPATNSTFIKQFTPYAQWINDAGSDSKRIGTGRISVDTPCGRFNLKPYGYMKQGEVLVIAKGNVVRIGASENREDGIKGQGLALELQGQSGSEMRAMCQFAPMPINPFWSGRMFNFATAAAPGTGYDVAA